MTPAAVSRTDRSNARTVLAFRASETVNNRRQFEGIFSYARDHGWHVQTFEYRRNASDPLYWRDPESGVQTGLMETLGFWKPSGCIVDAGSIELPFPRNAFGRIPVLYLDRCFDTLSGMTVSISSDGRCIAEAATREILRSGFKDCAFVPALRDYPWSVARKEEFVRLVRINRRVAHVFGGGKAASMAAWRDSLQEWLAALPKPCGVFAANDFIGKNVLDLCRAAEIDVPAEIVVVGVDDDPQICENTVPTLTSVRQDYENGACAACAMLDRMMENPRMKPQRMAYGVSYVTRRASSSICVDRRVLKALEFIRRNACERIGLDDVAREMGCSRRLATRVFRQSQGKSILDGIHDERLKRVKTLLGNPWQDTKALPDLCGYGSLVDLRRVFKARTGKTIGEFRRRLR